MSIDPDKLHRKKNRIYSMYEKNNEKNINFSDSNNNQLYYSPPTK